MVAGRICRRRVVARGTGGGSRIARSFDAAPASRGRCADGARFHTDRSDRPLVVHRAGSADAKRGTARARTGGSDRDSSGPRVERSAAAPRPRVAPGGRTLARGADLRGGETASCSPQNLRLFARGHR